MHLSTVLFQDHLLPVSLPVCDHYAGSEKLMRKSMCLQQKLSDSNAGATFDITFDCEDGASSGNEETQAKLIAKLIDSDENQFGRIGARIHSSSSIHFAQDVNIICTSRQLAYVVIPKTGNAAELQNAIKTISRQRDFSGLPPVPIHVLIETHGALAEVRQIAALPAVECLSFGIMDFVSAHYGRHSRQRYALSRTICPPADNAGKM